MFVLVFVCDCDNIQVAWLLGSIFKGSVGFQAVYLMAVLALVRPKRLRAVGLAELSYNHICSKRIM